MECVSEISCDEASRILGFVIRRARVMRGMGDRRMLAKQAGVPVKLTRDVEKALYPKRYTRTQLWEVVNPLGFRGQAAAEIGTLITIVGKGN